MRCHALAALALFAAASAAASCRGVVSPDAIDLATDLCTLLAQCDGEGVACPDAVTGHIEDYDDATALNALDVAEDCLLDCSTARACRDQNPLCMNEGEGCVVGHDCCGFTGGIAECRAAACCVPDGAPCDPAGGSCCSGPCDADGHCGDVSCQAPGEACDQNLDCCSKTCDRSLGQCVLSTCTPPREPCLLASECCPVLDENGQPTAQECTFDPAAATRVCTPPGGCLSCDPLSERNCCTENGLFCYAVGAQQTICGDATCAPPGAECGNDSDCCEGVCDDLGLFPHCAIIGH